MTLQEEITTWSAEVEKLYNEVYKFVNDNKLQSAPSFEDIMKRKILYESYSKVLELSNKLSELLGKVVAMQMLKNQYKRVVRMEYKQSSLVSSFNVYIDEVVERVNITDKMLSTYKYGLDNLLRFYQSIQYILGSPRLSSLD